MKNSIVLFLLVIFNVQITNGQTRNYDQELADILYAKRFKEAIDFYDQYKDSIYHSFTLDSYKLLTNIYLENPDSVFRQLPLFIEKYYGSIINDDFIFYLPSFYSDKGDYANHLKMLEILESFYNQRREKIDKLLNELSKLKNYYPSSQLEKIPVSSSNKKELSKENSPADGTTTSQSMVKPSSLLFSLNDKQIDFLQEAVILDTNPELYLGDNDIFLTLEFMKKFKNVTFDFYNMVFDGEINE